MQWLNRPDAEAACRRHAPQVSPHLPRLRAAAGPAPDTASPDSG